MNGSMFELDDSERLYRFLGNNMDSDERQKLVEEIESGIGYIATEVERLRENDFAPLTIIERFMRIRSPANKKNYTTITNPIQVSEPVDQSAKFAAALILLAFVRTSSLRIPNLTWRSEPGPNLADLSELQQRLDDGGTIAIRGEGTYLLFVNVAEGLYGLKVGHGVSQLFESFTFSFFSNDNVVLERRSTNKRVLITKSELNTLLSNKPTSWTASGVLN